MADKLQNREHLSSRYSVPPLVNVPPNITRIYDASYSAKVSPFLIHKLTDGGRKTRRITTLETRNERSLAGFGDPNEAPIFAFRFSRLHKYLYLI